LLKDEPSAQIPWTNTTLGLFCINTARPSRLRTSEHAVAVGALRSRDLFLQNVPMFRDLAVGHAENIDPNHGLRSPSDIAAMNHDIVAIGHHESGLVTEVRRQVRQYCLDRPRAVGNQRIMLPIIVAEQTIENGWIAIDENALDPCNKPAAYFVRSDLMPSSRDLNGVAGLAARINGTYQYLYRY
jgi:hypothetical protein